MMLSEIMHQQQLPSNLWLWNGGLVDVFENVPSISIEIEHGMIVLPFGEVRGSFFCESAGLISLKNSPRVVTRSFAVGNNPGLKSLTYGPRVVEGDYGCEGCSIVELTGLPQYIGGELDIRYNPLSPKAIIELLHVNAHNIRCNLSYQQILNKHWKSKDLLGYQGDLLDAGII